jgi:hypothetical protein
MNPFALRDYQIEVLRKRTHREPSDITRGACFRLAWCLEEKFIMDGLAAMQDKAEQNLNPEMEYTHNLTAYYFATLCGICKDNGVRWPLGK